MAPVQRLTVSYDRQEDRFRLLMLDSDSRIQAVWLTQRLLRMLVPELLGALDRAETGDTDGDHAYSRARSDEADGGEPPSDAHRAFWRQTTADLERRPAEPVNPAAHRGETHLLTGVTMTRTGARFTLELKWSDGAVVLPASTRYLRQLLRVLYNNCQKAAWPTAGVWPDWFAEDSYRQYVGERQIN